MQRVLIISSASFLDMSRQPLTILTDFTSEAISGAGTERTARSVFLDELVHVYDDERVVIKIGSTGEDIAEFDFIWLRGHFAPVLNEIGLVAQYLEHKGANYANQSYAYRSAYGKHAQMFRLHQLHMPFPKTVFAMGEGAAAAFTAELAFPMVVKNNQGGHGEKNYLVHTKEELYKVLASHPDTNFVAQEYIPNESDFRVLVAGDEQLIIRRKGKPGSHLNNTSQGATASLVSVDAFPSEVLVQAKEFAAALHYEVSGVDVLFSSKTNKHYFLEANSQPQIMSGAFVDEKKQLLRRYLESKLAR